MPTPSPTIEASVGATEGMSNSAASAVINPNALARPASAVPIGSPMAITEPKAMSSTTTAAKSPMTSWPSGAARTAWVGSSPPSSVCTPAAVVVAAVSCRAANAFLSTSPRGFA